MPLVFIIPYWRSIFKIFTMNLHCICRFSHHLVDICLQFQLYLLLFGHLVIVLGQWPLELPQENTHLVVFFFISLFPCPKALKMAKIAPFEALLASFEDILAPSVGLPAPPALSKALPAPSETQFRLRPSQFIWDPPCSYRVPPRSLGSPSSQKGATVSMEGLEGAGRA